MGVYQANEASFEVPNEWQDQSVNLFTSSKMVPSEFSLVITRDDPQDGEDLTSYVERQLNQLSKQLLQFNLIYQGETIVDNLQAWEIEFTWTAESGLMYQHQVYLLCKRALVMTATSPERLAKDCEAVFSKIVSTLRVKATQGNQ